MKRFMALMTATALCVGSTAWSQTAKVDSLIVAVSPAADNANVESVWPDLENDLKGVLDAKFERHRADDGYDVSVRIIDVSLNGSTILTEEDEFNHIEGWVYMRPDGNPGDVTPVKVSIDALTGAVYKNPEGEVQIPGAELFYTSMLNEFGDKTRELVLKMK